AMACPCPALRLVLARHSLACPRPVLRTSSRSVGIVGAMACPCPALRLVLARLSGLSLPGPMDELAVGRKHSRGNGLSLPGSLACPCPALWLVLAQLREPIHRYLIA